MPIYTFLCECGVKEEHVLKYEERDSEFDCPSCGEKMLRQGVEHFTAGEPSFQTKAVLRSGEKVPGHFGKEARKKGGWHRP